MINTWDENASLKLKRPSSATNCASPLYTKASSLVLCLCIGMSQWNLVNSFMIPQTGITQSSPSSSTSVPPSTAAICSYSATSTISFMSSRGGGNFQSRLGRYGGIPEEEQPAMKWDWDDEDNAMNNDDMFGGQKQAQPQATSNSDGESELPTGDIEGATITEDMKQKAKNTHLDVKEESSQGGSKFRELMARASQQTATAPPVQQPYAPPTPPQPQAPPAYSTGTPIPPNPMDLSIEEQAALFRQMMMEKQDPHTRDLAQFERQQQQQERKMKDPYQTATPRVYGPPPDLRRPYAHQPQQNPAAYADVAPPKKDFREYGTGSDGRKIGRNADADSLANAADVYLAQLKRDSTSRNYARYAGDDQVANQVFHDPSIQEIYVPENPYRVAQRERERELIETAPEEMLIFKDYNAVEEYQAAPRMSYKEKLAQFQTKRQQQQQDGQEQ